MEKVKDVKKFVRSNEWKKYGKHRIYIDVEISLVELKEVRGNVVGAFRGIKEKLYYDVKAGKVFYIERKAKDLTRAADDVIKFMKEEINKMITGELSRYGVEM